jgi:pyruvate formate lyase activating enzyme
MREPLFFGAGRCRLCPRRCAPSAYGACRVRGRHIPFYGKISSLALDPIEKKPLYRFSPGAMVFSVGFFGCNLHCPFCQNWRISQETGGPSRPFTPAGLLDLAEANFQGGERLIAYTYSEPLVHIEFLLDTMRLARERGIANILVTNGCVEPEVRSAVLPLTDAANVDLKCFSHDSYSSVLGGDLDSVLGFLRDARAWGVHLEVTTLVVPGFNDNEQEMQDIIGFLAGLGRDIPWHVSAYHPAWKWTAPATDPALVRRIAAMGREKLSFVYTGNI